MMNCYKCNVGCVIKENKTDTFGYPCDQCKRMVCKTCAGLSSSEVRAVVIPTRVMPFYCPHCRVNNIPALNKRLDKLENEIQDYSSSFNGKFIDLEQRILKLEDLKKNIKLIEQQKVTIEHHLKSNQLTEQRITHLEQLLDSYKSTPESNNQPSATLSEEFLVNEVYERQRRATNVMIYNLPESGHDAEEVNNISREITGNQDTREVKMFRVGKKNKNGARPLKVVFQTPEEAMMILKNRSKIDKSRKIFIDPDLTTLQLKNLKTMNEELRSRKANGEKVAIRYTKGKPIIVSLN